MGWNFDAVPATWVNVASGKRCHLFTDGDDVSLTLSAARASGYEVRDYWGDIVDSGVLVPDPPIPFGEGPHWLQLTAGSASIYTANALAALFVGDIEVIARVRPNWSSTDTRYVASLSGNPEQFAVGINGSNKLFFRWNDGTTHTATSSVTTGLSGSSTDKWVKYALADVGANVDVKFWLSDDGDTWTQLGTTQTVAASPPAATVAPGGYWIEFLAGGDPGSSFGRIYTLTVASSIDGTPDLTADFTSKENASTDDTFYGETGELWHLRNSASIAGPAFDTVSLDFGQLPLGWYRLYLTGDDEDATYGNAYGYLTFAVITDDPNLPANPSDGVTEASDYRFEHWDHVTRAVAGLGPHRNQIQTAATPTTEIAQIEADLAYQDAYAAVDPARPQAKFLLFPNGTHSTGQPAGVTETVAALYPAIEWFEGPANEPQGTAAATVAARMETFYNAVKAGHPDAKVLGPCPVAINGQTIAWWGQFLAAGGGDWIDGVSFHIYNGVNDDVILARKTLDIFVSLLADYGLENLPRWSSESTAYFGATYGINTPRRQASRWFLELLVSDQYAIPKEQLYTFYDTAHGFWDFPSFWKTEDGGLFPVIPMTRVFSGEVFGKTYTSAYTFPAPWNDWTLGNLYTDADTGEQVAAFVTSGAQENITFDLDGASSAVLVDCFGNTSALTGTTITVPVSEVPCYLRLAAGATLTPADTDQGANLLEAAVATSSISTSGNPIERVTNGELENWYYLGGADQVWGANDIAFPATLELAFDEAPLSLVEVLCPEPWQATGSLLDFDVQTLHDGEWTTRATFAEDAATFEFVIPSDSGGTFYEEFYSHRRVWLADLGQVTTRGLRLYIRDGTYGGNADVPFSPNDMGQGSSAKGVFIREVRGYYTEPVSPESAEPTPASRTRYVGAEHRTMSVGAQSSRRIAVPAETRVVTH